MNPASRIWDNPPPPGTEFEGEIPASISPKDKLPKTDKADLRPIDRIDPYLKNPDYVKYEKSRHRSRSRSCEGRYRRKRHSRSKSRDRRRRSRSRSRRKRIRPSRSRSRSQSRNRSYRRHRRRHSRSASRSRSRSRSRRTDSKLHSHRSHRHKSDRERSRLSKSRRKSTEYEVDMTPVDDANEIDFEEDEEPEPEVKNENVFKNDGSFLEMFKKLQEEQQRKAEAEKAAMEAKKTIPIFAKRRGGKVLKTGIVEKVRSINEEELAAQDAWSVYMKEVKKYKEACCDDDSKTRPLVK